MPDDLMRLDKDEKRRRASAEWWKRRSIAEFIAALRAKEPKQ